MRMTRRTFLCATGGGAALATGVCATPARAQKKQVVTIAFPETVTSMDPHPAPRNSPRESMYEAVFDRFLQQDRMIDVDDDEGNYPYVVPVPDRKIWIFWRNFGQENGASLSLESLRFSYRGPRLKRTRMRRMFDAQSYLPWSGEAMLQVQADYREKYGRISKILDEHPEILQRVHKDLTELSDGDEDGKEATFTSENIFRALLVHCIEGADWRETAVKLSEAPFLQEFVRLGNRPPMSPGFLCTCSKAIREETWKEVNQLLAKSAVDAEQIDPKVLRTDTTVVEANIHYPTDSSLLWDGWRVLVRLIRKAKETRPNLCGNRFHDKKAKKLHLFITRYVSSSNAQRQRLVKAKFKELLAHVREVVSLVETLLPKLESSGNEALVALAEAMKEHLPAVKNVANVTERVQIRGESVPASEKTYSIFEKHVELIKRGKKAKPVEFGHKVLVTQTKQKFITDYEVLGKQVPDSQLTEKVIEAHQKQFGAYPEVVAADRGFRGDPEKMETIEEKVKTVAIPKKVTDWGKPELQPWQPFRAGIEGSISVLKRGYRLMRCFYKGFKSFAASIGMAIFCHNLVQLSGALQE